MSAQRAFTLIELLIVIAIITTICAFSLTMSMDDYSGTHFRSARDSVAAALMHARAEAMANECFGDDCTEGRAHGVKVFDDTVVVFQAPTSTPDYDHRDTLQDEITNEQLSFAEGSARESVFLPISGNSTGKRTFIFAENDRTFSIVVYTNGRIEW